MLIEGVPDLYGRVELSTKDSDSLLITKIKISPGKWSQKQVDDSGEQLAQYLKLAREIRPWKKIAARFLVLTKTKEPQIEEHVREVNPATVKRTLAGVGWVVAGGLEKERLRETGPLFFAIRKRETTVRPHARSVLAAYGTLHPPMLYVPRSLHLPTAASGDSPLGGLSAMRKPR